MSTATMEPRTTSTGTMRAVVQDEYGHADVLKLEQIEIPEIGDDEVLVRVHAAGVDRGVWHLMTGLPYLIRIAGFGLMRPKTRTPGLDLAGTIERVGKNVTRFHPGDEVFGEGIGTFAEFARARENKLALKPENLSFEQAGALAISASAALEGLREAGDLQPGQHVLIIGASGGVGSYAVQIAKAMGAVVSGVASTSKIDFVRELGADHVIDYKLEQIPQDGRFDLILDIGGNRPVSELRRALATSGTLVIAGGEEGGSLIGGVQRQLGAMLRSPFVSQKLTSYISLVNHKQLEELKSMVEAGHIKPTIDRSFPLSEAPDAIQYIESGHAKGKVIITT